MINIGKIEIDNAYQYQLYKAKNTFWYFNDLIKSKSTNYRSVKFKNEENVYVWLENVMIEGNYYSGVLSENNSPLKVLIDDIIDWMIIDNGRLIGGYTIRHYRSTLSEEEKINFDIDFGVKIDDGNDFFYPDLSTAEGALITLEGFYTKNSLDGALSCKDFYKEAKNILIETRKDLDEYLITETAELLKLSFIENLQKNGMPNFENIERVFNRLVFNEKEHKVLIEEKLIYSDGEENVNKFWIAENESKEWKVLDLVE